MVERVPRQGVRAKVPSVPEQLARTYCSAAWDRRSDLPYGEVHHLQGSESDIRHSMVFQNIYHIGDTKSAQELEVFLRMSRERLRLGFSALTACIPMDRISVRSSSLQLLNCCGLQLERKLFSVKMKHNGYFCCGPSGWTIGL